jgi:hypothetical protein
MKLTFYRNLTLTIAMALALLSCSFERKLGNQFVTTEASKSVIYLEPTGYLFKTNLKNTTAPKGEKLSQSELDAAKYQSSKFLKLISDSVFLTRFTDAYMAELNALGLNVCLEGPSSSGCQPRTYNYKISIDQLEIQEFEQTITDEQLIYNAVYQKDINLDALSMHAWFLISEYAVSKGQPKPLYAEHQLTDEIVKSGFLRSRKTGKILHQLKADKINLPKIYAMAEELGRKYASYSFDYILNHYIYTSYPKNHKPDRYLHYNRFTGKLESAGDEHFTRQK